MAKIRFESKQTENLDENSHEIFAIAKKRGIKIPSVHLGFFRSIYCEIEKPNLNNIILSQKAVEEALPGLISAQVNFEHYGAYFCMGSILDAWINENNEVEVVYSFFKSLYPDEYEQSIELAKAGNLAVSFEITAETNAMEKLSDGNTRLNSIDFMGMGHLMSHPPACPKSKIYEYASALKNRLATVQDRELVFASKIEATCNEILEAKVKEGKENTALTDSLESDKNKDKFNKDSKINSQEGGNNQVTEEQKTKIAELRAELGDVAKDVSDEDLLDETKVAELKETYKAYKLDSVEVRTYSVVDNDGVEVIEENVQRVTKTDYNAMQEAVTKVSELESENETLKATLEAKDSEVEDVRVNAEKIGKAKVELKDNEFASDFSDEDYLDEEKVAKAIQDKKNTEVIAQRKEELKENEYATDFSDEDYLDESKVELAKVKKENTELKAKIPVETTETIEASLENKEDQDETVVLNAGAEENIESEEKKTEDIFASIRKANKEAREEGYQVRTKESNS